MKKIIVLTTGGTIGSILKSENVGVDVSEQKIASEIRQAREALGYTVEVHSVFNKNSESLSPADWISLLEALQFHNDSDADGIVITHGTDTMVYSVSAVLSFSGNWKKKICFTGSYLSPDHPDSDASINLLAALSFAASSEPENGVYVAFRSNTENREAHILPASQLKPMSFDDLCFSASYGDVISDYRSESGISLRTVKRDIVPEIPCHDLPSKESVLASLNQVVCLKLYPGITKDLLFQISRGKKFLILETYHSGTGPADGEYHDLLDFLREKDTNLQVLMGCLPKRYIETPYSSTDELIKSGGIIYGDIQPHYLYVFTLLSLSLGRKAVEILESLSSWKVG